MISLAAQFTSIEQMTNKSRNHKLGTRGFSNLFTMSGICNPDYLYFALSIIGITDPPLEGRAQKKESAMG
ncbi:MAG: hypothetical protein IT223_12445 [Crocinitomicaceae bacterium]|nr:hypothetical protein [Crocinitomicaceae bacterium]